MPETQQLEPCYEIPFKAYSKLKPGMHFLFVLMIIFFSACIFLPIHDVEGVISRIFSELFVAFFFYLWLFTGVLRKAFVELDGEGITVKTAFFKERLLWSDVALLYSTGNIRICFVSRKKYEKKTNNPSAISTMFSNKYSLVLSLKPFPDIDYEKIVCTIKKMI